MGYKIRNPLPFVVFLAYKDYESQCCELIPEFIGEHQACLEMEKEKLLYYPGLPKNLKRGKNALLLPPGNKIAK